MRLIDADKLKEKKEYSEERHEYIVSVAQIDWQPTIQPQGIDKDRLEHAIKLLEFCKQRHIDIATDLPHTADREADKISCYEMALKVVRALLQQPTTDGWIPVSEKYPVCYEKVLVTVKRDGELGMYGYFYKIAYLKNDGTWSDSADVGKVLAWQPLPQPYKESE